MIETPVYKGTEMRFDDLLSNLKKSNVGVVQLLQSKPTPNSYDLVINEDIYLVGSCAMKVKVASGQSAMCINDDVYVSLIGTEQSKVSEIERIVQLNFTKL
jgi:hypothetical protein